MDMTTCPECGALAEVEFRSVLESTDGPVEHARIRCAQLHWFLLPVSQLTSKTAVAPTTPWETSPGLRAQPPL